MKVNKIANKLSELRENGSKQFPIRMTESKLAKATAELKDLLERPIRTLEAGIENWNEIAVGLLKVGG